MEAASNPLVSDRDVEFILYEVLDAPLLCALPHFADHGRETFDMFLQGARRLARDELFPAYKAMDEQPPVFADGTIRVHPRMRALYPRLLELGLVNATRPSAVDGQQLPLAVASMAHAYLMAGNLSAYGYVGLTSGAAHLIEAFGDATTQRLFMDRMYRGEWTGTMALTEPQAGSSLADVQTTAAPAGDGTYRIRGAKIFISAGDHDLTDNIVHLVLARIAGAPAGVRGISLFAVPKRRPAADGGLVDNDVHTAGAIHKIGWRGLPSLVMSFGERDDCRGWLVGEPHRGLAHMFQMMNESRIMVGLNGVATASVAYHQALAYARDRAQGRPPSAKDPATPQVPLIHHADIRRMLLRQKAIVEGGLSLLAHAAWYGDLAEHATAPELRERAGRLLDLLTPVAKTFPAEYGFEATALALQIHGGYGYSSEYLPEAWLRDQKLNSIHEGTSGIQAMDLLGRKVIGDGGAGLRAFGEELRVAMRRARDAGVEPQWCDQLERAMAQVVEVAGTLATAGDPELMLRHASDFMQLFSIVCVAWQWLLQAAAAHEGLERDGRGPSDSFYRGKLQAAKYWFRTELPRVERLAALCRDNEDSYAVMQPSWF